MYLSTSIYSVTGRLVRQLMDKVAGPGVVEATWDGCDACGVRIPAGVYFVRADFGPWHETRKIVVLH